tara:strand:- start:1581 stop:2540 length:960 start_codon:yes stop_codon:yes gene_type:complete
MFYPVYLTYTQVLMIEPNSKRVVGYSMPLYSNIEVTSYINMMNQHSFQYAVTYGSVLTYQPYQYFYQNQKISTTPNYQTKQNEISTAQFQVPTKQPSNSVFTQTESFSKPKFSVGIKKCSKSKARKSKNNRSFLPKVDFKFDPPTTTFSNSESAFHYGVPERESKKVKTIDVEEELIYEEKPHYIQNVEEILKEVEVEENKDNQIYIKVEPQINKVSTVNELDECLDFIDVPPETDENQWDVIYERPKFEGMKMYKYGRGYLLKCPSTHPDYGKKYYHNAWWQNCNDGWFLKMKDKKYFIENGADFVYQGEEDDFEEID